MPMTASPKTCRTILITGANSGFGLALAQVALGAGHRVVGTVRNLAARDAFDALSPNRSFGRQLDVTDDDKVAAVVTEVEQSIGAVDVLVNNAGYGHEGTLEESSMQELRRQFDVNVFGAVAMTKAVLPFMRRRRRGHIVNVTSMGGLMTLPGLSFYHGSKFALEGISESLGKELRALNIAVTAVAPGSFRTDWAGRSMVRAPRSIPDYDEVFDPIRRARQEHSGRQAGDPAKAARAILEIIESPHPPSHLLLGTDALRLVREKLDALRREIDDWSHVSMSTNFD